ncbi:MAG: hypothetical protein IKE53_00360 [Clostridiales bacterium]|nr:hypothetical protein [Clostridiales bacterium]
MADKYIGSTVSLILTACFAASVFSCADKTDDTSDPVIDTGGSICDPYSSDYQCGNDDVDSLYFTSRVVTLPSRNLTDNGVFRSGDYLAVKCENIKNIVIYRVDWDGNIISESDNIWDMNMFPYEFCDLGGEFFLAACYGYSYVKYDYEGNVVQTGPADDSIGYVESLISFEDGFVITSSSCAVRYDAEGNETGRITFDAAIDDPHLFVQRGTLYISGMIGVYELDWDSCKAVYKGDPKEYDGGYKEMGLLQKCAGFTGSDSGAPGFETYCDETYFWEADILNRKTEKIAKRSNIMRTPPRVNPDQSDPSYLIIDKQHYVSVYNYWDADFCDVVLMTPDTGGNYASRERLTVQGVSVTRDSLLSRAAYMYNTSQDAYYVELQPVGENYDISITEQLDRFRLDRLSAYHNGDAPDMFYGNLFDYRYWGENGMCIDMSPYLGDMSNISPNILQMMKGGNGEIYQVFASYNVFGFWGRDSAFDTSDDLTLDDLSGLRLSDGTIRLESRYILRNIFLYSLDRLYHSGELNYDNILSAIDLSLTVGTPGTDYRMQYDENDIQEMMDNSDLVSTEILSASQYHQFELQMRDNALYFGYPSINDPVYPVQVQGLVAISYASEHPDACGVFIQYLLSDDLQRYVAVSSGFPVNDIILNEYLDYMCEPYSVPSDLELLYSTAYIHHYIDNVEGFTIEAMDRTEADVLLDQLAKADTLPVCDSGISDILEEELTSLSSQGKTPEEVAGILESRLLLYAQENYG